MGLLAALLFWDRMDLKALLVLTDAPGAVAICLMLVLSMIPLAALRWSILLRALGLSIPFSHLVHFVAISLVTSLFLFGPTGGDAVRGVYAWRAIGGASGRVAASVLADRIFSLFGLLCISLVFALFNWPWMREIPPLAALGTFLFVTFAAGIAAACALVIAPDVTRGLEQRLVRWPRIAQLGVHLHGLVVLFHSNPLRLASAFVVAVGSQLLGVVAVVVVAYAVKIGRLGTADFMFAVPLTLVANALPLTPNGLGIGEAAFDQICRWLEPVPSGAAYSSIFFAYRALSMLAALPGLASFVIYRNKADPS